VTLDKLEGTDEIQRIKIGTAISDPDSIERLKLVLQQAIAIKGLKASNWYPDPNGRATVLELTLRPGYAAILSSNDDQSSWSIQIKAVKAKVILDAGHGGKDVGAISVKKHYEKEFTLEMVKRIEQELQKIPGIEPVLTRSDDRFLSLDERASASTRNGADLFVSLHGNSNVRKSIRGTETYYYSKASYEFAALLHKRIIAAAKLPDRKVRSAKFIVLRNNTVPSTLLEIGYMSNATDEQQLLNAAFQSRVAKAIAEGIADYATKQLAP
jgi:N-acetylmuramoyl-L-alanine amidase